MADWNAADVRGGRQRSGGDLPLPRRPGVAGRADAEVAGDDETGGVWMNWFLGSPAEVAAAHGLALRHGMTVTHPPTDEPWGVREFYLRHPDGHTFRVGAG
jgi:catechol 2,3-dioxygenase-like lactoylglutathione lyase family enzyme